MLNDLNILNNPPLLAQKLWLDKSTGSRVQFPITKECFYLFIAHLIFLNLTLTRFHRAKLCQQLILQGKEKRGGI